MGRGGVGETVVEAEALPLDHLFAADEFDPIADPDQAWSALYHRQPQLFVPLREPLSEPTEWPVYAFLYALAHDEVERAPFSDEQKREIDRAARFLRALTGLTLPSVAVYRWKPGSVAFGRYYEQVNPGSRGFSLAAEPLLRTGILVKPSLLDEEDPQQVASLVVHEVQHSAHAITADPRSYAYRQRLISAGEELAVLLCEQVIRMALRDQGASRSDFEVWAAKNQGTVAGDWLKIALDLAPTGEPEEMSKQLSDLAIALLALDSDEQAAVLMNACSSLTLGAVEWRKRFDDAAFTSR